MTAAVRLRASYERSSILVAVDGAELEQEGRLESVPMAPREIVAAASADFARAPR